MNVSSGVISHYHNIGKLKCDKLLQWIDRHHPTGYRRGKLMRRNFIVAKREEKSL